MDDMRRFDSVCCCCGRTGNGRRKGFGAAERRRCVLASASVDEDMLSLIGRTGELLITDWRFVDGGGIGAGAFGGGDTRSRRGGLEWLRVPVLLRLGLRSRVVASTSLERLVRTWGRVGRAMGAIGISRVIGLSGPDSKGTNDGAAIGDMSRIAAGRSTSVIFGDAGPNKECRWRGGSSISTGAKFSFVTGRGCMDLRRDAMLLLGFMWNDLRDIALRGSASRAGGDSLSGDCGPGDDSLDVLRVP